MNHIFLENNDLLEDILMGPTLNTKAFEKAASKNT